MSILRRFTDFVLQGRIQACAIAFVLAYIPIIGSVSVLIPGLVTLRKGALEGALVFLAATAPYLLSYFGATQSATVQIDLALVAVVIVAASNALMWIFAIILRRYSSWGFILDLAVVLGVVIIGMIHFIYPDVKEWWGQQLTGYFNKTAVMMREMQPSAEVVPADVRVQVVNAIKLYATGIFFVSIMFNALLQLVISRWWQAIMFNPGALRQELLRIRLSYMAGALFLTCYSLASFGNETAKDIMPVMYLIFSAAGLSIAHYLLVERLGLRWLVVLYAGSIGVMVLFPGGVALIALLFSAVAFFDIGLNFRKRLAKLS
jgi:hypothetical protein